ncbi:hypothetical protein [Bacillus cereus]|uniref:hypothetical protein n=1 Tax=Bacillus cereus TaxID=1396 RepID=UPI0036256905
MIWKKYDAMRMMMIARLVDGRKVVIYPSPISDEEMLWRVVDEHESETNLRFNAIHQWHRVEIIGKAKKFKDTTTCYLNIEGNNIVFNILKD